MTIMKTMTNGRARPLTLLLALCACAAPAVTAAGCAEQKTASAEEEPFPFDVAPGKGDVGLVLEQAFRIRAAVECKRQLACQPHNYRDRFKTWPDEASCRADKHRRWVAEASIPGIRVSAAKQLACAYKVWGMSCRALVEADLNGADVSGPAECNIEPLGALAHGAVCHRDDQCASGVCQRRLERRQQPGGFTRTGPVTCGTCQPALAAGAPCTALLWWLDELPADAMTSRCGSGLQCASVCDDLISTPTAWNECLQLHGDAGKCAPWPPADDQGALVGSGNARLGEPCATAADCKQSRTGYAICDPQQKVCATPLTTAGAPCAADEAAGYADNTCNTQQHGLTCVDPCDRWSFLDPETGDFDEAAIASCLQTEQPRCEPVDVGAAVGQACGMIVEEQSFHTQDCAADAYCKFAQPTDDVGACAPRIALGSACDPAYTGSWGEQCQNGLNCGPGGLCAVETAPVCAAPAK